MTIMIHITYFFILLPLATASVKVSIDTSKALHTVDDKFISVTMDQELLLPPKWINFDFR